MKERNKLSATFILTILLTILLASWLICNIINDISLLFSDNIYLAVLVAICFCLIISIVLLRSFLVEVRYDIDEQKSKKKNIRDVYLYNQLLDPPSTNN